MKPLTFEQTDQKETAEGKKTNVNHYSTLSTDSHTHLFILFIQDTPSMRTRHH